MTPEYLHYRIGALRVRVAVEDLDGELAPVTVELYDPKARTFSPALHLMRAVNSLEAEKITAAAFFAP